MSFNHIVNLSLAPMHPAAPIAREILNVHSTKASKLTFAHFVEVCGSRVQGMLAAISMCPDPGFPTHL